MAILTTLTAEADTYVSMQGSAETRRAYRRDLFKWFEYAGAMAVMGVGTELVLGFKTELETNLSPASAARTWGTVKGYYKFLCARLGKWEPTPFEYIKGPKRTTGVTPKVPVDEDVVACLSQARQYPQRHVIFALLLNGLRAGEVTALKWSDIEQHDGLGTILRVNGKGQKQRLVPATVETELAIASWQDHMTRGGTTPASDYVVSDYDGSQFTVRQVEHAVYKSAEYAGVEGMHPHALRHHYATRLVRAGAGWGHVQKLLGHANISTTMVYVTLDLADLVKAAAMDPMDERRITEVKESIAS